MKKSLSQLEANIYKLTLQKKKILFPYLKVLGEKGIFTGFG